METTKYQRGKIYKLVCNKTKLTYYGSTICLLSTRLYFHKNKPSCVSRIIIANNDYNIILVENYPCNNKEELLKRERYYIDNNKCINKQMPTRSVNEYYKDNKQTILTHKKQYYKDNIDKINNRRRQIVNCPHCNKSLQKQCLKRHIKNVHN